MSKRRILVVLGLAALMQSLASAVPVLLSLEDYAKVAARPLHSLVSSSRDGVGESARSKLPSRVSKVGKEECEAESGLARPAWLLNTSASDTLEGNRTENKRRLLKCLNVCDVVEDRTLVGFANWVYDDIKTLKQCVDLCHDTEQEEKPCRSGVFFPQSYSCILATESRRTQADMMSDDTFEPTFYFDVDCDEADK